MKGLLPLAIVLLAFWCWGCGDYMSPDDYSHAWRLSVKQYRDIDKDPSDPAAIQSGNGDGSAEAQSQAAGYISQQIRTVADSIKDLKPPPEFSLLQEETYLFYRGVSDRYSGLSEAMGTNDAYKMGRAVDGLNTYADDEEKKINSIIKGLGKNAYMFQPQWQGVMKDSKG